MLLLMMIDLRVLPLLFYCLPLFDSLLSLASAPITPRAHALGLILQFCLAYLYIE